MARSTSSSMRGDPIRFEVIRSGLVAASEEMGAALQRSAYSTNIKTRADFSCALLDSKRRVVAQSYLQPTLLGALAHVVPRAIEEYGPENLCPGDGILINDPHRGSVHLNDVALISPIFHDDEIVGYAANIAHHVDVGGGSPGSMGVFEEIYQEGLVVPPVKFVKGGEIDPDLLRFIMANVRAKRETAGDFRAQVAANNTGIRRVTELIAKFGWETISETVEDLLDYTERRTRAELRSIPAGIYEAEDFLDDDGKSDEPVRIAVRIVVSEDDLLFDLSGCDAQRRGTTNATYTMSFGAVAFVLRCLMPDDVPINEGFYRRVHIEAPLGTVVNATHPAPVAGGWEVTFRLAGTLFRALAQVVPRRVVAGTKGVICNVAFGGVDPRSGEYYAFYETVGGGFGARASKDGMDGVQAHVHNTENAPVEETELNYPVRIVRYELIPDSGGAGRYRGGLGIRRDYQFVDHEASFTLLSDRAKFPPWGLFGGQPGWTARYLRDPEGETIPLPSKVTVRLRSGEMTSVQTPGGGGYGDPLERDPDAVGRDVAEGKVSERMAQGSYGVVLLEGGEVDRRATESLRARLRRDRGGDSGQI